MADLDDYGPFDAGIGANRNEDFWRDFFRHVTRTGVIDGVGSELAVSERGAGANMSVDVAAGECFMRGHWGESTSVKNLPIATADGSNPRIDRVVLHLDTGANKITLEVLEGTPAGSPSAPALTQNAATWEIPLAQVSVPASDTTIGNAQITDERGFLAFDGYRFGSTTARDLHLTAPSEGDQCWVLGTYDILYHYNGSAWVVLLARGAGSPENNVTANIGAVYERTDGSTGTTLYVKESGTGNTGWAAVGGASAFVGCRAIRTANKTITTATMTAVDFTGTDTYDTDSMHDPASNATRITIPAGKGGYYHIDFHGHWASSATGQRFAKLRKNGTTDIAGAGAVGFGDVHAIALSTTVNLAAADYIEIYVYQSSGGDLVLREVDTASLRFEAYKVG